MVQKLNIEFEFNVSLLDKWLEKQGDGAKTGLAYSIGVTPTMIDKLRVKRNLPTGSNLAAFAAALGVPIDHLVIRVPKKKSA
jgi:hypothetical protein